MQLGEIARAATVTCGVPLASEREERVMAVIIRTAPGIELREVQVTDAVEELLVQVAIPKRGRLCLMQAGERRGRLGPHRVPQRSRAPALPGRRRGPKDISASSSRARFPRRKWIAPRRSSGTGSSLSFGSCSRRENLQTFTWPRSWPATKSLPKGRLGRSLWPANPFRSTQQRAGTSQGGG